MASITAYPFTQLPVLVESLTQVSDLGMISPRPARAGDQAYVTLVDVQDICLSLQGKDERDKDTGGPLGSELNQNELLSYHPRKESNSPRLQRLWIAADTFLLIPLPD